MRAWSALLLGLLAAPALADDSSYLAMIPTAATKDQGQQQVVPRGNGRISIENAVAGSVLRGGLAIPLPGQLPPRWQDRTSLDGRWRWNLGESVSVTFSDRANLFLQDGLPFGRGGTVTNDLREAYATWEFLPRTYFEAGRINLRHGAALGYNPTDFFRASTLIAQSSADPAALRENRLGTGMVRMQHIASWGAISLAWAPKLYQPDRIDTGSPAALDPQFDRTNHSERMLLSIHVDVGDLAPELLVFRNGGETRIGANISKPIGKQIIAYAEWSGGRQRNLVAEAMDYGVRTGTMPPGTILLPGAGSGRQFRNDITAGFSWTGESKVTVNLEYIFHEAGLSGSDWDRLFTLGRNSQVLGNEFWYLRAYAADQQVPTGRQQIFLRAYWPDGLIRDVDLTALTFVSLDDSSAFAQVSANWNISRTWTAGFYVGANLGPPGSTYGSLKTAVSGTAQIVHDF
jgi:hypothetical protein